MNQVADDSIPWEKVKRRSAPVTASVSRPLTVTKHRTKAASIQQLLNNGQNSTAPTCTTEEKPHDPHENWCGVCSLKLPNKTALQNHIKQSPNHQNYCNLCKRVFKDRNGLKNHVDNSLGHETYCNLCLSAFKDQWGLKNHFENNYSVGHEFVCLTCLTGFKTSAELDRHLQTAEKHTWCQTCQRRFRNQDERDEHWVKTLSKQPNASYIARAFKEDLTDMLTGHKHCLQPGCNFDGLDQASLTEHLRRDHFQCQGCKRILPSLTKLNQHYETCLFTLSCPQCGEKCAGKAQLELHMTHCFRCEECDFHTCHKGNFNIVSKDTASLGPMRNEELTTSQHMTKHSSADLVCWGCDAPMRKYSSLINHLESGNCPKLGQATPLMRCLGMWWYSPLYMDLDLHAHIRTGRVDIHKVCEWMSEGALHPFLCRDKECGKTFSQLSSLLLHCESTACGWDVDRLNMPGLEKEFKQWCLRRDSGTCPL